MLEWIQKLLRDEPGLSEEDRKAWLVTLRWYMGYVSKNQLGDPASRDNGKVFWKEAELKKTAYIKGNKSLPRRGA